MDYFKNSYQYEWRNFIGSNSISQLKQYYDAKFSHTIEFSTPRLWCRAAITGGWIDLFEMNVTTYIVRQEAQKVEFIDSGVYRYETIEGTRQVIAIFQSGPESMPTRNDQRAYVSGGVARLRRIRSDSKRKQSSPAGNWENYYDTTGILARVQTPNHRAISFTIPALTPQEIEAGKGYIYTIECVANPITSSAMLASYTAVHKGKSTFIPLFPFGSITEYDWDIWTSSATAVNSNTVKITVSFWHQDFDVATQGGYLIAKGTKYNCYKLLRKALLTTDAHIIDNSIMSLDEYNYLGQPLPSLQLPIIIDTTDTDLISKLTKTDIYESVFEEKNLWEILLQIGHYIHAIPYLEFAHGLDKFILRYRQLGGAETNSNVSTKITVFNSRNLSDFFTQYDSYVTNLFSPQNVVEEWVVPKTSDSSFLVSNNTAELQLSYGITELVELKIYLRLDGQWEERDATEHVFEKSIYDILSNENPYKVYPSKGSALYYSLGDNKIQGLNFVPPSFSQGEMPMALKRILQILWQGMTIPGDIKFNELKFKVKYRTQDSARVSQVRPDIQKFMRNSAYEKYPKHEQFYGQQDKIVDSERFSANLWGRLIRVGNNIYQMQEYTTAPNEKICGQLVTINNEPYYITAIDSEYYPDAIFQKVTYSKDFNQLSNIVTIPSEPRFYEISERSKIRREIRIMEFLELSTDPTQGSGSPRFLNDYEWKDFIKQLIFNTEAITLPNYAWTRFKVDNFRVHFDSQGFAVPHNQMFPSSMVDRTDPNAITPADPSDHCDCIVPLLHFPLRNGIVFEWDMADNFKAGDYVDDHIYYDAGDPPPVDEAYLTMQPLRYVDIMGRADLFRFALFYKDEWTHEQAQKLPQAVINPPLNSIALVKGGPNFAIALEKDNRESLSFNFQINLIYKDRDFMTYPNLFGQKNGALKACILFETQSIFYDRIDLSGKVDIEYSISETYSRIIINFMEPEDWNVPDENGLTLAEKCKSIVFYQDDGVVYIAKNVDKETNKLKPWYIYPVYNNN